MTDVFSIGIIGLERNYRGADLEAQLAAYGHSPVRVAGVVVDELEGTLDDYVDQDAALVLQRRKLTHGEVGCALAHRSAWSNLTGAGKSFAMIFEDDARLKSNPITPELIEIMGSNQPRIVVFDSYLRHTIVRQKRRIAANGGESAFAEAVVPPPGAWAYAINRPAALLLLENGRRVASVTDWPARVAHRVKFYVADPRIAEVDGQAVSTLESTRHEQETSNIEGTGQKIARLLLTASHIRWFANKDAYLSYSAYFHHEIRRLILQKVSR